MALSPGSSARRTTLSHQAPPAHPAAHDGDFHRSKHLQDPIAFSLFILHLIPVIILGITLLPSYRPSPNLYFLVANVIPILNAGHLFPYLVAGLAAATTLLHLTLLRYFPGTVTLASPWITCGAFAASVVVCGVEKQWGWMCLMMVLTIRCFWSGILSNKAEVHMQAAFLQYVFDLLKIYRGLLLVALVVSVMGMGYLLRFGFILEAARHYSYPVEGSDAKRATLWALCLSIGYLLLSLIWILNSLRAFVHSTVARIVAADYFFGPSKKPSSLVWTSTKQTIKSFGTLAIGAFFGSILSGVREMEDLWTGLVPCLKISCVPCCDGMIAITRFCSLWYHAVNDYVYSYVAIHEQPYIPAARATFKLLGVRTLSPILHYRFLSHQTALPSLTATLIAIAISNRLQLLPETHEVIPIAFQVWLVCLVVSSTMVSVVRAGVLSTVLYLCEEPEKLRPKEERLWRRMMVCLPEAP